MDTVPKARLAAALSPSSSAALWAPFTDGCHQRPRKTDLQEPVYNLLEISSLLHPPGAQGGEPAQAVGGERRTEVAVDHLGRSMMAHQAFEHLQGSFGLLVGKRVGAEDAVTVVVADGERIAALPVAEGKPAFEVHLPHVVGLSRLGATVGGGLINAGPAAASHTQAMSFGTPATVLHAGGERMPRLVSSITRSFFGPHVRCSRRSRGSAR